jgi:hypothetical protein
MIVLDATTKKLEVATSAAGSLDAYACWADVTTTAFTPGANQFNVTTATTTDLVAAPGASTQRQVKTVALLNRGTATQTVTVKIDVSGTEYLLAPSVALAAGEALQYTDTDGWQVLDVAGRRKVAARDSQGIDGTPFWFYKIGTAAEAVGVWYSWHKDTGNPGAWAPGAPGVNGRATDGTVAADAGCLPIRTPASGGNYLVGFDCASSVGGSRALVDVLWVNSGLVVTTTTAQALTSVAWPARDNQGSTNGEGVYVGILVTTATTNAAAIANTTMSYTNSDGTAGRTATMASYPATAVIGTVVWFQLEAGDKGVRSIQSVTLGTSRVAGAISIFAARILATVGNPVVNIGNSAAIDKNTGVRLYTGTCALLMGLMSATTAATITGTAQVAVR